MSENNTEQTRAEALAEFLGIELDEITEGYDEQTFEVGREQYLVLTDEEADERAKEYIEQSAWAFNASFLSSYTGMPEEMFTAVQDKCEDANDAILRCIEMAGSIEEFAKEAISADGRGHFMSSYDGHENEQGEFFIYRVN